MHSSSPAKDVWMPHGLELPCAVLVVLPSSTDDPQATDPRGARIVSDETKSEASFMAVSFRGFEQLRAHRRKGEGSIGRTAGPSAVGIKPVPIGVQGSRGPGHIKTVGFFLFRPFLRSYSSAVAAPCLAAPRHLPAPIGPRTRRRSAT